MIPKENVAEKNGAIFSDHIYVSVNQRLSDHAQTKLFHPLKKPVDCVLWTSYYDPLSDKPNVRATLITGMEYGFLMKNPDLLPADSWVESQLGTIIMGTMPSHFSWVQETYSDLKAQIAFYNGDLKTLLSNKSNRSWIVHDNVDEKMSFLKSHILPFHPECRQQYLQRFEGYVTKKSQKKLFSATNTCEKRESLLANKALSQKFM